MSTNPITEILTTFVNELSKKPKSKFHHIAQKVGMSREGLRKAISPDKQVESFKVRTLLNITMAFPITIHISEGKIKAFRWDKIESQYLKNEENDFGPPT